MTDERGAASSLKGRLADVYVPALVHGELEALVRRLGSRATIDDPLYGRASTLSSIEALLEKVAARFARVGATYRHLASVRGIDRDVTEGVLDVTLQGARTEAPVAVVAKRKRLREIDVRVYYALLPDEQRGRQPIVDAPSDEPVPQIVAHVLEALRRGAVERVLAAFEESSRFVDASGKAHTKRDGKMAEFLSRAGGVDLVPTGIADDGRLCCVETLATRLRPLDAPEPAALTFERGDSGLIRELRLYY